MDISGRIRAVLAAYPLEGREDRIFARMATHVLRPEKDFSARKLVEEEGMRRAQALLAEAGRLRISHSGPRPHREEALVVAAMQGPVELLWSHWIRTLTERVAGVRNDPALMRQLWERGFAEQDEGAAPLHVLTAEMLLDGFVYDELCAIHAAYNSAKIMGDAGMIEQVRRAVRWHVENTQPDNSTNEPWGLAAFAALDETGTFAEQQLHDTVTRLRNSPPLPGGRVPVAVGLLADAVMTLEG